MVNQFSVLLERRQSINEKRIIGPHFPLSLCHQQWNRTWTIAAIFRTATGIHGGQFSIQNETEPSIRTVRQFQSGWIRPNVQTITSTAYTPFAPVICFALQYFFSVFEGIVTCCESNWTVIYNLFWVLNRNQPFAIESDDLMTSESDSLLLPISACTLENTPNRAKWSRNSSCVFDMSSSIMMRTTRWPSSSSYQTKMNKTKFRNF